MTFDPVDFVPARPLIPRTTDLRGRPVPPPKYVPGPLAEGAARVVLSDDYYTGTSFGDYDDRSGALARDVFDVPREQYERWEAAVAAYSQMQEEIESLMSERRRHATS